MSNRNTLLFGAIFVAAGAAIAADHVTHATRAAPEPVNAATDATAPCSAAAPSAATAPCAASAPAAPSAPCAAAAPCAAGAL